MKEKKQIGLAIVGCGTIGRIRAIMARDYPGIGWIGLCDINSDLGNKLLDDCEADFFTKESALAKKLCRYKDQKKSQPPKKSKKGSKNLTYFFDFLPIGSVVFSSRAKARDLISDAGIICCSAFYIPKRFV